MWAEACFPGCRMVWSALPHCHYCAQGLMLIDCNKDQMKAHLALCLFYWSTAQLILLCVVSVCFHATMAKFRSCNRTHKYFLSCVLQKGLLTPGLQAVQTDLRHDPAVMVWFSLLWHPQDNISVHGASTPQHFFPFSPFPKQEITTYLFLTYLNRVKRNNRW